MAMDHVKEMSKVFESYRFTHSVYTAFEDFLEVAAISISNSVDRPNWQRREDRYMQIIGKYSKEEANGFAKLLAILSVAMDERPDDYLGRLFMELELYDQWKGQFFTPYHVAEMMAKMTVADLDKLLQQKDYVTVNEPATGGGVTLIALFNEMRALGHNPQQTMQVVAQDIDRKAVYMTYIQLSLLGLNAEVIHGNTLTLETWDVWRTPGHFFRWGYGDPGRKQSAFEQDAEEKAKLVPVIELTTNESGQLSFF